MQVVTSFAPIIGESVVVNLLQQSGYTEVINDTNFLLVIQTNNGTCYHIPGEVQIYPTPVGGGVFTVQGVVQYLATDPGIADFVTINQYLEDELIGTSYPYFISRSVQTAQNTLGSSIVVATGTNLVNGLTTTVTGASLPSGLPTQAFYHLTGVDFSVDQEATAHGWTLTLNGFTGFPATTPTYVGHTKTATDTQLILRWSPALISNTQGANINVSAQIASVVGSTARGALNMYGYFQ